MSAPQHRHKKQFGSSRCKPFRSCAAPFRCDPRSHGDFEMVDTCACGATRRVNINQRFIERGQWQEAQ